MDPTRVSELSFGRKCRLALAAWVMQTIQRAGTFSLSPAASSTASSSNIIEELKKLVEFWMLDVKRPEDSRHIYYVRTNSPLWDIIAARCGDRRRGEHGQVTASIGRNLRPNVPLLLARHR